MIDVRPALKSGLSTLTYTGADGQPHEVNVYLETDITSGRAEWVTPALLIRGMSIIPRPADIGWNNYTEVGEVVVSLYLKQRATAYDAYSVRDELSKKIEEWVRANKAGIGGSHYLKLVAVTDRDWVEAKGTLRRDFTLEVYYESWEG